MSEECPGAIPEIADRSTNSNAAVYGDRCDPAYPEVCIVSPPPDVECEDLPFNTFRVLPPDPHQLGRR